MTFLSWWDVINYPNFKFRLKQWDPNIRSLYPQIYCWAHEQYYAYWLSNVMEPKPERCPDTLSRLASFLVPGCIVPWIITSCQLDIESQSEHIPFFCSKMGQVWLCFSRHFGTDGSSEVTSPQRFVCLFVPEPPGSPQKGLCNMHIWLLISAKWPSILV